MKPDIIRRMSSTLRPSNINIAPTPQQIFQVSELISTLKHGLEMNFPRFWVEGEISNFLAARSGHWYFTLKDQRSQIRCVCFRNRNMALPAPKEGARVMVRGQATLYVQRGDLQLLVEDLQDAGAGALHQAFERLKKKLQDEGLFDEAHKQGIPSNPRCIGIISSADGAAVHDVLATLQRRNPLSSVRLYHSSVQGELAPQQLRLALASALQDDACDVIVLSRGGGSLEDLQAFNDESLARDIAAAKLPIVSAVGHEVDFSICDFVADVRAPTPTAAAELLSPDSSAWLRRIEQQRQQLQQLLQNRISHARQDNQQQRRRLLALSPQRRLQDRAQWLDDLQRRLQQQARQNLATARLQLRQHQMRLQQASPLLDVTNAREQQKNLKHRMQELLVKQIENRQLRLLHAKERLAALSPTQVLQRGYSITRLGEKIVRQADLPAGSQLDIELAQGKIRATVSEND
ncbi:MAG: exodeoxyribonuclease VII large subunit [Oceanococcus sp.]